LIVNITYPDYPWLYDSYHVPCYPKGVTIDNNIVYVANWKSILILRIIGHYICDYTPGDINGDGRVIGSDVTFGVNYFRGIGAVPPISCLNGVDHEWLYSAADANGDCRFIGSDITYLVSYFRMLNDGPRWCPNTPPAGQE
jgi:hypothetical protein